MSQQEWERLLRLYGDIRAQCNCVNWWDHRGALIFDHTGACLVDQMNFRFERWMRSRTRPMVSEDIGK